MCFGVQYLFCLPSYNGNYFFKPFERKKTGGKEKKNNKINQALRRVFPKLMCSDSLLGGPVGHPCFF